MNKFLIFGVLVFSLCEALGALVVVRGQSGEILFEKEIIVKLPTTVGDLTVLAFDSSSVPYVGDRKGISKIFDLEQKIEVVSDREMKAYGWCFSNDGISPDTMPDQTFIGEIYSKIVWFYGYARYFNGEWVTQCSVD